MNILNVTYKRKSYFPHHTNHTAGGNHSNFELARISIVKNSTEVEFINKRFMATSKVLQRLQILGPPVNFCLLDCNL